MVVVGTLTALHLNADSIFTKAYEVSSDGALFSTGKSYGTSTAGFFLGKHGGQ